MARGRKPRHPHLKVISGTDRPDRRQAEAVTFDLVENFPDPPQHFNADGAEMWNTLGQQLLAAGVLQAVDLYPLQQLCYAWQCHMKKQKAGMPITAAEETALKGLFSEFGMSWSSRQRSAGHGLPNNPFAGNGKKPKK